VTQEQIVTQLQQIVVTLQRIVTASGELADRVATIESRSSDPGPLTAIQGTLSLLLEQLQKQGEEQASTNAAVHQALQDQQRRIEILENRLNEPTP
jgi:hypothetical protein